MANVSITKCHTISDFKDYVDLADITYPKTFLKSIIKTDSGTLIVNSTSLPNKYYDFILRSTRTTTLTDDQMRRYRYNPKLLCFDLYGTVELWGLLLKVNNMTSATEFTKSKIKIFTSEIFSVLNDIFVLEDHNITENKEMLKEVY